MSAWAVGEERADRYRAHIDVLERPRDVGLDADDPGHHRDRGLDRLRGRTALRVTRDGRDAVRDLHLEPCRVEPHDAEQDLLADRIREPVIGANESADPGGSRPDTHELAATP